PSDRRGDLVCKHRARDNRKEKSDRVRPVEEDIPPRQLFIEFALAVECRNGNDPDHRTVFGHDGTVSDDIGEEPDCLALGEKTLLFEDEIQECLSTQAGVEEFGGKHLRLAARLDRGPEVDIEVCIEVVRDLDALSIIEMLERHRDVYPQLALDFG